MKAKIFNDTYWVKECNSKKLKDALNKILNECKFNVLDFVEYEFKPQGYTALWLLAESHLAVHTFPEENKTYIELSSCNEEKSKIFNYKINIL